MKKTVLLLVCGVIILSCRKDRNDSVPIATPDSSKEVLHFDEKFETINLPLPDSGQTKNVILHRIEGFCLNKNYELIQFLDMKLIASQEEFETVASNSCDTIRQMPIVDFSRNRIAAILLDDKIQTLQGLEPIEVEYRLDSCYRTYNELTLKFTVMEIEKDLKTVLEQNTTVGSQLILYQIPIDKNLEVVYITNGMTGLKGKVNKK